ncbi:MAG: orotate phosphoribosyltransferase [Cyanobacteria bacterium P01_C01_bin.89]|mgnify:CR=1 FL=1
MTDTSWAVDTAVPTDLRDSLLAFLCKAAYKEGDFTLSSGQKSTYYINCKPVTLDAQGALAIGRLLLPMLPKNTQAVAGLTLGADPIVSAVSVVSAYERSPIPALIIRKEAKGHGTMDYVEGPVLAKGASVVVLEDVVTTGGSALKAVERLQAVGYSVNRVLALVDRKQGGAELYAKNNLTFEALYSIEDVQAKWRKLQA